MTRPMTAPFEDSISNALGVLYERKALSNTLIRVLENYRRFCGHATMPSHRTSRPASPDTAAPSKQELERLYLRRAAVDHAIRSIEAYSGSVISSQSHR